jgi:hypothetical protein
MTALDYLIHALTTLVMGATPALIAILYARAAAIQAGAAAWLAAENTKKIDAINQGLASGTTIKPYRPTISPEDKHSE